MDNAYCSFCLLEQTDKALHAVRELRDSLIQAGQVDLTTFATEQIHIIRCGGADIFALTELRNKVLMLGKNNTLPLKVCNDTSSAIDRLLDGINNLTEDIFDITGYRDLVYPFYEDLRRGSNEITDPLFDPHLYKAGLVQRDNIVRHLSTDLHLSCYFCNCGKNIQLTRIGMLSSPCDLVSTPIKSYCSNDFKAVLDFNSACRLATDTGTQKLIVPRLEFTKKVHNLFDSALNELQSSEKLHHSREKIELYRRHIRDIFAFELLFRSRIP